MYRIAKRDGSVAEFDLGKIRTAIGKAFNSLGKDPQPSILDMLATRAVADAEPKVKNGTLAVEDIQDSVEKILSESGYYDVAKSYILYRQKHANVRNAHNTLLDYQKVMDGYLKAADWRVKENSTVSYSLGGLILGNSGAITANYWLSEIYDPDIADAHRNTYIHLHDLSMLSGYCAGWNLKQLIERGIGGVPGRISSKPASHLSTLCNQMVNFLGIMQNEWAGAQAFSSFDTYLAPFVRVDRLTYGEVKQAIQSFIFGVNTPSRWGCVDTDTEVLSTTGFKKYDELMEGDLIYTWKDGTVNVNPVRKVIVKPYKGVLHEWTSGNYKQTVTPNHRMIVLDEDKGEYMIRRSEDLQYTPIVPLQMEENNKHYDETVAVLAQSPHMFDEKNCAFLPRNDAERDRIQRLLVTLGLTSYTDEEGQIRVFKYAAIKIAKRIEIPYDGLVWCPNVEDGTAVFRKDGCVFISGQTQAPFTNVTIDWTVPDDLKDLPAIVGGKEMPFTYGDCQAEMDMVNKAFIEVMTEGDADGRGFQYPIKQVA